MLAGGWSDIKTMMIYMRKAEFSIRWMTDGLRLHDPEKPEGKVLSLYGCNG